MLKIIAFASLLLCLGAAASPPAPSEPALRLTAPGSDTTLTLARIRDRIRSRVVTVDDAVYKKRKTYRGVLLSEVLQAAGIGAVAGDEIVLHCADGYAPTMPYADLDTYRPLLAFRDEQAADGWEPLMQGKAWITPAPFYLVPTTGADGFIWPYQVIGVEIVRFADRYPKIFPRGAAANGPEQRGFRLFKTHCLKCHSMNLQGGDLGPELNYPKNVTEYRDRRTLIDFIRDPSAFRARSKMPAFPDLDPQHMRDLLSYLEWMKQHKSGE